MKRTQKDEPDSYGRLVLEAALAAAEQLGSNGKGRDGLNGCLQLLAKHYPVQNAGLLVAVLDLETPEKPNQSWKDRRPS